MTIIAEHAEGHYEVEGVAHGKVYVWHSGQVVVDCGCGERPVLNTSDSTCQCGTNHAALIEEELGSRRRLEEASRPLDRECHEWQNNQDEYLRSEKDYQLELSAID